MIVAQKRRDRRRAGQHRTVMKWARSVTSRVGPWLAFYPLCRRPRPVDEQGRDKGNVIANVEGVRGWFTLGLNFSTMSYENLFRWRTIDYMQPTERARLSSKGS